MHSEITREAIIENGKLKIHDVHGMHEEISLLNDCEVEVIIRKKIKTRSFKQNAYYWGVVIPSIQKGIKELGERLTLNETENWLIDFLASTDKDFTHTFLKHKFIDNFKVDENTGEIIEVKQSTRKLNKENFAEYIERIIQFANEVLEIEIPEPTNN
jgi:hypothetical protein